MSSDKISIRFKGAITEYDLIAASDGAHAVDISKLTLNTGLTSYDQGFVNTASTKSAITFIDGDNGILRHRGYPIAELAEKKSFLEVSHLLIYGELPNVGQTEKFDATIRRHTLLLGQRKHTNIPVAP